MAISIHFLSVFDRVHYNWGKHVVYSIVAFELQYMYMQPKKNVDIIILNAYLCVSDHDNSPKEAQLF